MLLTRPSFSAGHLVQRTGTFTAISLFVKQFIDVVIVTMLMLDFMVSQ
jgi:hypothetical protein